MGKFPQSLDKFFKYLLSDLERAREYMRAYLPEELTAALDQEVKRLPNRLLVSALLIMKGNIKE